uniref:Uncharacterized protein n=1 Tax=Rhizophora mucronata TaxID=61149 RepID=A0A2P2Q322_RHIMU
MIIDFWDSVNCANQVRGAKNFAFPCGPLVTIRKFTWNHLCNMFLLLLSDERSKLCFNLTGDHVPYKQNLM